MWQRRAYYNNNNSGLNRTVVDFFVILGVFLTIYIAYVNTLNYKANKTAVESTSKSAETQKQILELAKRVNTELL